MPTDRALFIPLARRWYEGFENGEKQHEYRRYGARWNERTCAVGRPVVLSLGYGKQRRMRGVVTGFRIVGPEACTDIRSVYPDGDRFAEIAITVDILT